MEKLSGKWVVAVSGGVDSMALLDMCYQNGMDIVVAHVDYQKRKTSKRDAKNVKAYCKKYDIPFYLHQVESYPKSGNFQGIARKIRYTFFKKINKEINGEGVLVAHHQDDLIETYLMQKQRKSIPTFYGIKREVEIYGIKVVRLLLNQSKRQLEDYCIKHHLTYYHDESNFTSIYTRNKIRHTLVKKMSESDKKALIKEIDLKNQERMKFLKKVKRFKFEIDSYQKIKDEQFRFEVLRTFILKHSDIKSITLKSIKELDGLIINHQNNFNFEVKDYVISKNYDKLEITLKEKDHYRYLIRSNKEFETPYFKIASQGKTIEKFSVNQEEFPLVIRNYLPGDFIRLKIGKKKVSRFFIDRKISRNKRNLWPVVTNKNDEIIFVYGIGCDIYHFSNNINLFMIK